MEIPTDFYGNCLFLFICIGFLIWWTMARMGLDKRWFIVPASPYVSSGFYFFLPTGMLGLLIGLVGFVIELVSPNVNTIGFYCGAFMLWPLGFLFAYLEPGWMSPAWYRWLKKEHGDILPMLIEDAEQIGRAAWLEQTKTQQGLEQWVAEVRHKHGL